MRWRQWQIAAIGVVLLVHPAVTSANSSSAILDSRQSLMLTIEGGGLGVTVDEEIWFEQLPFGRSSRWVIRRQGTDSNWCGRHENQTCAQTTNKIREYVDARFCPALFGVLRRLAKVRAAERGSVHSVVTDTPLVTLATFHGPTMETERLAEYTGPLVDWWQLAQEQLKSCWSDRAPPEA